MARDTTDETPITSMAELTGYIAAGCKPEEAFRIGTEHEKFPFFYRDNAPVPYEGERSIAALLRGMEAMLGWEPIMDAGRIIGLVEPTGQGAISLEPGGQFELSGAPLETIHQTCRESTRTWHRCARWPSSSASASSAWAAARNGHGRRRRACPSRATTS